MSARRALLTGAAGFIGASLIRRLLSEGHDVHVLLRPGSDRWRLQEIDGGLAIYEVDLRDRDAVEGAVQKADADWIFHLAAHGAYSWQTDARGIFESNITGTLNLAEACVQRGFGAFVHAGSSSEYGFKDHAPSEEEAPEPNSDYAIAKVTATLLCRHLAAKHELRIATLRLYSVYGPWEDPRRLMPTLVTHGLRHRWPDLVDPDTARDFVHVDDVCDAFMLAAETALEGSNGIYNVGSGSQTSLRELVEIAARVLDISEPPQWSSHEPRAWDAAVWVSDPRKIERELGWHPQRELEPSLADLGAWLLEHPSLGERYGLRD